MNDVTVGILGTGFMAHAHLIRWRKLRGAKVAGLSSASGRGLDGNFSHVAGNIGSGNETVDLSGIKTFRDHRDLAVDPAVQVIDICLPTETHLDFIHVALSAGKDVICEKPLTRTAEAARRVAALVEQFPGQLFMPAMCCRYWPGYDRMLQAAKQGTYGKLLRADFRRQGGMPGWGSHFADGTKSGGALVDLLIHDFDLALALGKKLKSAHAVGRKGPSGAIDDVQALLRCESGASIVVQGGWMVPPGFGFEMWFRVHFEGAILEFGGDHLLVTEASPEKQKIALTGDGWENELAHFLECVQTRRQPSVTVGDAVRAVTLCEEIEQLCLAN